MSLVDLDKLKEYEDCLSSLREIEELLKDNPEDEEMLLLANDAREQLPRLTAALDFRATDIVIDERAAGMRVEGNNSFTGDSVMVLPYDAGSAINGSNIYEVLFDNTTWYSCVVVQKLSARSGEGRVKFRVHIIGYNIEEIVLVDNLRAWQAPEGQLLASKQQCHAVHCSGWFQPCVIDRLTPHGTVIVTFTNTDLKEGRVVELPPCYLRTGRVYRTLIKKNMLSEEERKERTQQASQRKRDRQGFTKQKKVDVVEQNRSDWNGLMDVLSGAA